MLCSFSNNWTASQMIMWSILDQYLIFYEEKIIFRKSLRAMAVALRFPTQKGFQETEVLFFFLLFPLVT